MLNMTTEHAITVSVGSDDGPIVKDGYDNTAFRVSSITFAWSDDTEDGNLYTNLSLRGSKLTKDGRRKTNSGYLISPTRLQSIPEFTPKED